MQETKEIIMNKISEKQAVFKILCLETCKGLYPVSDEECTGSGPRKRPSPHRAATSLATQTSSFSQLYVEMLGGDSGFKSGLLKLELAFKSHDNKEHLTTSHGSLEEPDL